MRTGGLSGDCRHVDGALCRADRGWWRWRCSWAGVLRAAHAEDAPPQLPAYFTATNDPQGAGVAGSDRRGRRVSGRRRPATARATCPSKLTLSGRLRPRRPQPVLDQHRVDAGHRLPRHVHAGRLHVRRDRPVPRQERLAHGGDELSDLPARLPRRSGPTASPSAGATGGTARWRRGGTRRSAPASRC